MLRVQQVLQGQVRSASEKARRSVQLDLELDPVNIRRSTLDIEGKKELIWVINVRLGRGTAADRRLSSSVNEWVVISIRTGIR